MQVYFREKKTDEDSPLTAVSPTEEESEAGSFTVPLNCITSRLMLYSFNSAPDVMGTYPYSWMQESPPLGSCCNEKIRQEFVLCDMTTYNPFDAPDTEPMQEKFTHLVQEDHLYQEAPPPLSGYTTQPYHHQESPPPLSGYTTQQYHHQESNFPVDTRVVTSPPPHQSLPFSPILTASTPGSHLPPIAFPPSFDYSQPAYSHTSTLDANPFTHGKWGGDEFHVESNPFEDFKSFDPYTAPVVPISSIGTKGLINWDSSDEEEDTDDDEDNVTDDFEIAKILQAELDEELRAPHPESGGYRDEIPSAFVLVERDLLGKILVRVSSKKLFRKWKEMFFRMNTENIFLYESNVDYECGAPPKLMFPIHAAMFIRKPAVKSTFSMMDNGRRIFFTNFRENDPDQCGTDYSFESNSCRLCKFGAYNMDEISCFAHSIHGCVLVQRKLAKQGASDIKGRYN